MTLRVLSCARGEFIEAVDYYNQQSPGLGYALALEVREAFDRVEGFPTAWPIYRSGARRCLVKRFPYGVLYLVEGDVVLVVGLMHLRRAAAQWEDRLQATASARPKSGKR